MIFFGCFIREAFAQHLKAMKELEGKYNKQSKRREVLDKPSCSVLSFLVSNVQIFFNMYFEPLLQELEDNLKSCAEEFKEFERQDLKYREDLKHMKQKLKKLDEKMEKVNTLLSLNYQDELCDDFL